MREGGSYTLNGDQYTEHLDFYSDHNWEGKPFTFTVTIKDDTLTQRGLEKVENENIDPGTAKNVKESINEVKRIYTRVEVAPQFPGGEDAWNNYLVDFCRRHKDDLTKT